MVLREWAMSVYSQRMGTSASILGGGFSLERTVASQGIRDKITSAANRLASIYFIYPSYQCCPIYFIFTIKKLVFLCVAVP